MQADVTSHTLTKINSCLHRLANAVIKSSLWHIV